MPNLSVFNMVSLDGYIADANGDMSWAHTSDPEWLAFVHGNAGSGGQFLFGRVTCQMMASYWPTPAAKANDPAVAEAMNSQPKTVFSRTLDKAAWSNTRLVRQDLAGEVAKLKKAPGEQIVIFGSGSIVAQLTAAGLIDTYQIAVVPIVLGAGKSMFAGVGDKVGLKQTGVRAFKNGRVLLTYARQ